MPVLYVAAGMTVEQAVNRFNANISYSGLLHAVTADVSTDQHLHSGVSWLCMYGETSHLLLLSPSSSP